ncbi:hypothetical protein [uncultured Friedmanniella sp.]|uniref:hypothetical protein n=1 Tax=uncultured Friedmanniella sp. TaxID=335381 RepID=UPI0035C9EAC4
MSARIALSSKLPGDDEVNGLDSLHAAIIENPHQVIAALVWLDVPKITTDTEVDDPEKAQRPTVRVRRIEPFGAVDKVPAAVVKLALDLQTARTGRTPLPFDSIDARETHVEFVTDDEEPSEAEQLAEAKEAAEADGQPLATVLDPFGKRNR